MPKKARNYGNVFLDLLYWRPKLKKAKTQQEVPFVTQK